MVKNRTTQLIYQSIYIGISIIAMLASFGLFDAAYRWDFYIHFTNLSNFLCIIVMLVELHDTANKHEDSFVTTHPVVKFSALLSILLTFIIYNFILSALRDPKSSFTVGSITLHIILPLMFILDYVLFYEHGKLKWYYPLLATVFPLLYVLFVFVHAGFYRFDASILCFDKTVPFIYPYFFLNIDKLGILGVLNSIIIILVCFIVVGYVIMFIDRLFHKLLR